jgi:hypothetical protein
METDEVGRAEACKQDKLAQSESADGPTLIML